MLALGAFDQDVNDKLCVKFPKLYTPGLTSSLFNKQEFFRSALQGFLTSCVLFFMNYGKMQYGLYILIVMGKNLVSKTWKSFNIRKTW